MSKFKKKLTVLVSAAVAMALIVGAWAYYSSESNLVNPLETKKYGSDIEEKFTPEDDWEPGQTVVKETGVRNTGDYDLFVRVRMEEAWIYKGGANNFIAHNSESEAFHSVTGPLATPDPLFATQVDQTGGYTGDESVVYKKIADPSDWVFSEDDGYWYYKKKLEPAGTTGNLLESITLAANTDMGNYISTRYYTTAAEALKPGAEDIGTDPATEWVEYTGKMPEGTTFTRVITALDESNKGYADANYTLTIYTQTLQGTKEAFDGTPSWDASKIPDEVKTAWGV